MLLITGDHHLTLQIRHSILADLALPDPVVDLHLGGEKGEGAVTPPSTHLVLARLHSHWLQHKIFSSRAFTEIDFYGQPIGKKDSTLAVLQSYW